MLDELRNAAPGIAGSLLALMFLRRPLFVLAGMFVGGSLLSYYGANWLAEWLSIERHTGLAGFVLGLFGMAVVAKVYDTIDALAPTEVAKAVIEAIRKRLGV
jgi:hypothetical protein